MLPRSGSCRTGGILHASSQVCVANANCIFRGTAMFGRKTWAARKLLQVQALNHAVNTIWRTIAVHVDFVSRELS